MTFPSFEHLEAVAGLSIDVISCCCVSGNREAQGEEGKQGNSGTVRTHMFIE